MAKPKAKSEEEKKAALDQMLKLGATANHLTGEGVVSASIPPKSAPTALSVSEPTTGNQEQKGEKVSVAPAPETTATAISEVGLPTQENAPEPAPAVQMPAPVLEPTPSPSPETNSESESIEDSTVDPTASVEVTADREAASFDLTSLFVPSSEKKTFSLRIPDRHYQYLLLLGTIVGAGASPPDIIYNLVEQFIDKHDAEVQKAIQKKLRQRLKKS